MMNVFKYLFIPKFLNYIILVFKIEANFCLKNIIHKGKSKICTVPIITHIQQFPIFRNFLLFIPKYRICPATILSGVFNLIYYLKSETILNGDGLNCLKPPVLLDVPDIALGISEYRSDVPHGGKTQWQIDKHLFPVKRIIGN